MAEFPPNDGVPVYDPRRVVTATAQPIAPRVARLKGLRLAVLDSTTRNGDVLLRKATEKLAADSFADSRY